MISLPMSIPYSAMASFEKSHGKIVIAVRVIPAGAKELDCAKHGPERVLAMPLQPLEDTVAVDKAATFIDRVPPLDEAPLFFSAPPRLAVRQAQPVECPLLRGPSYRPLRMRILARMICVGLPSRSDAYRLNLCGRVGRHPSPSLRHCPVPAGGRFPSARDAGHPR